MITTRSHCLLFHKRSTDWDSPLGYKQVISHCTRRISLLLTLVLRFALDSCNNNDILLIVGYNYNKYIYIYIYIYIYHFDTLDQRKRRADKSRIAHLSVQYKKYRTLFSLIHSTVSSNLCTRGRVRIYQAKHKCLCYNYTYIICVYICKS